MKLAVLLGVLVVAGIAASRAEADPGFSSVPEMRLQSPSLWDRTSVRVALGLGAAAWATARFHDGNGMVAAFEGTPLDTPLLDVGEVYGSGTTLGAASLGFLAVGSLTGNREMSVLGSDLTRSLLATWTAVWILKFSVQARRPNGGSYSFPSGHAATAFAAAPVFSRHLGTGAGIAAYGIAGFTALSRMEDGKHYPRDVLMGAAIGLVMGDLIGSSGRGLQIAPGPGGLSFSLHF